MLIDHRHEVIELTSQDGEHVAYGCVFTEGGKMHLESDKEKHYEMLVKRDQSNSDKTSGPPMIRWLTWSEIFGRTKECYGVFDENDMLLSIHYEWFLAYEAAKAHLITRIPF